VGQQNLIKNFMTQRKYCADDIMGVLFIMLCITALAMTIYGILQFVSPETQKSRQCQAIFDTQKSEINEMQQEYYNKNCK
jgi:hypothetical protein